MNEGDGPANGTSPDEDPVAKWWVECGNPLKNALRWIEIWRLEARDGNPREITYQEFDLRCTGHLVFDGEAYVMVEGVAEQVIARLGRPGLAHVEKATAKQADLELVSRLHYELACHIATTNKMAGRQLPEALLPFAATVATPVKRSKGPSSEDKRLFRTLANWGVDRGIQLGLHQAKNRGEPARNPHKNKRPSATELTVQAFEAAGWRHVTYNAVNEAWQALGYEGAQKSWKQSIKFNAAAHRSRFEKIGELIKMLPSSTEPDG